MSDPQSVAGGPGAALLAERRRQNLSLGDVSRQLKLSVRQVEALERDDFSGFQGPVFIHGFIRNYAKLLALDPQPLIRAADALLKPASVVPEPEKAASTPAPRAAAQDKPRWPLLAGIGAIVVVAGLLVLNSRNPAPVKPKPVAEPGSQLARAPAGGTKSADKPAPEKTPPDKPAAEKVRAEKPAADKPAEERRASDPRTEETPAADAPARKAVQVPEASSEPVASAQAVEPSGPRLVVRMIFEQESWVEIKDRNGNTVFGQLNAAGTRRSASGEPPLTIVVGNAAGVRLFQGDKSIDLAPYTRVDVARLTLE